MCIVGINIIGLEKYMLFVNLLRMLAHARFVYVRMSLLSVTLDEEEGCVQVGQVEHPLDVSDDDDDDDDYMFAGQVEHHRARDARVLSAVLS